MRKNIYILIGALVWLISGCQDKAMVNIYNKEILSNPPSCLSLSVIPPYLELEKRLKELYKFTPECPYVMSVSYKSNIHCTSNQNSQRKALSAFPNSFLSISIRKGMRSSYEYYIDLTSRATPDDAEDAIERIMDDLQLNR